MVWRSSLERSGLLPIYSPFWWMVWALGTSAAENPSESYFWKNGWLTMLPPTMGRISTLPAQRLTIWFLVVLVLQIIGRAKLE